MGRASCHAAGSDRLDRKSLTPLFRNYILSDRAQALRGGDVDEPKVANNADAQATSLFAIVVLLCIGLAIAFWIWPTGVTDLSLAAATIGELLRAIASVVITIVSFALVVLLWLH